MAYISLLYIRISISKHKSALMVSKTIPTIGRRNAHMKPFAIYVCIVYILSHYIKTKTIDEKRTQLSSTVQKLQMRMRCDGLKILFLLAYLCIQQTLFEMRNADNIKLAKTSTYIYI